MGHNYVLKEVSKEPNTKPHANYMTLKGLEWAVVRKRCHSKSYHDEKERAIALGFSEVKAKQMARKISLITIAKWEKRVKP